MSTLTYDRRGRESKGKCDRGMTGEGGYKEIAQNGVT